MPTTIVGVAPAGFFGLEVGAPPDFWMPAAMEPLIQHPSRRLDGSLGFKLMGRLKAGLSIEQTRAEMAVLDRWRVEELAHSSHDPLIRQLKIDVESAATGFASLRDHVKKPLSLLMLVVGLLLLIACGNLATMLLARGAVRQHELALRVSLGAGRSLLLRQSLIESFLLSSAGTLVGFCLAVFGSEALLRVLASGRQIIGLPADLKLQLHTDSHTLLFTAAIAIITTLLFGLAPAYNASTAAPISLVHGTDRQTTVRLQFGKGVVIAQLALSMGLLSLAAIFVGYLAHLQHTYLGFQRDHVLLVKLDSDHSGYDEKELFGYYRQLLDRLQAIPGVSSAAVSAVTPLSGAGAARFVEAEGHSDIAGLAAMFP